MMVRIRQWWATASILGVLLVGPAQCDPDRYRPDSAERTVSGPRPVAATDPDGDPSQPQPTQRPALRMQAR